MNTGIQNKLEALKERVEELNALLSDPSIISDHHTFRQFSIELSEVKPVVTQYAIYKTLTEETEQATGMLEDEDLSIRQLAQDELPRLKKKLAAEEEKLRILLVPKDPNDARNVYLEIRAGTGGDEAALFAGDLFRMYVTFAEKQHWKIEITSKSTDTKPLEKEEKPEIITTKENEYKPEENKTGLETKKDEKKTVQIQSEMSGLDEKIPEDSNDEKQKKEDLEIPSFLRNQSN